MLCRVLLTIIAISCTFSREIIVQAYEQSPQRLVQIKDIICVLLLSGLQKEDLDVNVLKKLQRHNVNIEDLNNENIRQECLSTSQSDIPARTTESTMDDDKNKIFDKLTQAHLQTVMKYFIDLQTSDKQTKAPPNIKDNTTKDVFNSEKYTTVQISDIKSDFDVNVKYEQSNHKKNPPETQLIDGLKNPDLHKFIKLWNMYNKMNTKDNINTEKVTTESLQFNQYTTRPNLFKPNNNEQETQIISKMFMNYLSKNKINPTTALPASPKTIDFNEISQQIQQYLVNNDNNKKIIIDDSKTNPDIPMKLVNFFPNDIQREGKVKILQRNDTQDFNSIKETLKGKANQYLSQVFGTNDPIHVNEPVINYIQSVTHDPYSFPQSEFNMRTPMTPYKSSYNNNATKKINFSIEEKLSNSNNKDDVSANIVKGIAESVKAIILKDLRKDISTVTPKYIYWTKPQTFTEKSTESTTTKQDKLPDTNNIMEKLIDLMQQFKTVAEKSVISGDVKFKSSEKKTIQQEYKGPLKVEYPQSMPAINPYGMMMPPAQVTPKFQNQYDLNTNINIPLLHNTKKNDNVKSVHKITQVNIFHPKNYPQTAPLTIQTNLYQIPPLGIPILKPIQAFSQNILVTTKNPFERLKVNRLRGDIIRHERNYNNNRNQNDWHHANSLPNRELAYEDVVYDKYKDSTRDSRLTTNIRERPKYSGNYNDNDRYRSEYYIPHFNKSDYDRMRLRNQEIKKFHEKLERIEDSNTMDDREDCCNLEIASRQQLPLSNIKRGSRYDDTHFKNFLKTQQKVNDMLERVLATKASPGETGSVEIP